ncbi:MAG TPA: porin PorA family protein, partial [Jatrophihabitans sp.]
MRKILASVLTALGIFSLVLAGLLRFYAPSRVEKAPLDLKVPHQVATGPAKVYNVAAGQLEDVQLMATRQVVTDSAASDSEVAVLQVTLCIVKLVDDPPYCGTDKNDDRIVRIIVDRAPADRKTGLAVHDAKYGENIDGAPVRHEGLTYKFPFHAKKTTYKFFDVNSKQAADARFIGTDKVRGLNTY